MSTSDSKDHLRFKLSHYLPLKNWSIQCSSLLVYSSFNPCHLKGLWRMSAAPRMVAARPSPWRASFSVRAALGGWWRGAVAALRWWSGRGSGCVQWREGGGRCMEVREGGCCSPSEPLPAAMAGAATAAAAAALATRSSALAAGSGLPRDVNALETFVALKLRLSPTVIFYLYMITSKLLVGLASNHNDPSTTKRLEIYFSSLRL
jgi:hypothetical protein